MTFTVLVNIAVVRVGVPPARAQLELIATELLS